MVALGGIVVGVVVVGALLTATLLALGRPAIDYGVVLGAGPWMVVAGLLHVLGAVGTYPRAFRQAVSLPVGVLLVFLFGAAVWIITRQFAMVRNVVPSSGRYLAASGAGTTVVLAAVLLALTTPTADELLWLVTTPVLAAIIAGGSMLSLGVFDPVGVSRTRWVGLLVAFGFSALGTTVAVGVDVFALPTSSMTRPFITLGAALPTAELSVAWPLGLAGGLLGALTVSVLARIIRWKTNVGLALAVAVVGGSLTPAVALLATVALR